MPQQEGKEDGTMATPKTAAQKREQSAYMEKFAVVHVRMSKEQHEIIKAHAEARGESVNGFINRAIEETMEREK